MDLLTIIICSSLPLLLTAAECQNYTAPSENTVFNFTQSFPSILTQLSTVPVLVSLVTIPVPYILLSARIGIKIPDDLDPDTNVSCALIWLGQDGAPVRVSNVIHSPGGTADTLTFINSQQNNSVCENKTVTGALLIGENSCSINKNTNNTVNVIALNSTALDINNLTQYLSIHNSDNEIEALIRSVLMVTADTTLQPFVIILISTSVPASLLLCITLTILCIMFCTRSKKIHRSNSRQLDDFNRPLLSNSKSPCDKQSSMIPNLLYNNKGMIQQAQVVREVADIEHSLCNTTDNNVLEWTREAKIRRKQRVEYTFRPTFGIMAPAVDFTPYNLQRTDDWKYDRSNLVYLREIGEGQFGKVLLMKANNIAGFKGALPVAVKTLSSTRQQDVRNFTEEVELMKRFCHPNIVSLLGVSFHNEGAPLMILEYMPYGDLQEFLEKHRHTQLVHLGHQLTFAKDVAQALSFLEFKKYIHRDVAARNCLVGPCLEAKLADFGMARRVGQDWYVSSGPGLLPIRWTAPEALTQRVYTSASDVWSYGVLLWEIATFGELPLNGLDSQEILDKSQDETLHHAWPPGSCMPLRNLAMQCHNFNPKARPSFSRILAIIQEIITAH